MSRSNQYILIIGCFDTKGEDFSFLYKCIRNHHKNVITINTGVMSTSVDFPIDFPSEEVAMEAGYSLTELREQSDRAHVMEVMGVGVRRMVSKLVAGKTIIGAIGMGGGGGTFIILTAMQDIPLGIPKICLSTLAGKDLSARIGNKDITLMPTIVDVAGLNSISKLLIRQAAAAICAMANIARTEEPEFHGRVAITMFGNTTACVSKCSELLKTEGYEVFAFHANGIGGKTMESLINEHWFDAVLDITTTELADDLCSGVCSAGPERMEAAGKVGIPQVIVPGCLDMVNFGRPDTVPEKYRHRDLYSWTPDVTLMRTNEEENLILGERLVNKARGAVTSVTICLPTRGVSQIDAKDGVFYRPDIDQILFESIKKHAAGAIKVIEADAHINDEKFSRLIVNELVELIKREKK